jgi:hypothetical protein
VRVPARRAGRRNQNGESRTPPLCDALYHSLPFGDGRLFILIRTPYRFRFGRTSDKHKRFGPRTLACRDFIHRAFAGDRAILLGNGGTAYAFVAVTVFHQEPLLRLLRECSRSNRIRTSTQPPCSLLPARDTFSSPLVYCALRIPKLGRAPESSVPKHDCSPRHARPSESIFEVAVCKRMVFDFDR